MNSSALILWTRSFPVEGRSGYLVLLSSFIEIPVFNANSAFPDQMPHSVASDLDLHCFPVFRLWHAGHKWVVILLQVVKSMYIRNE